MDPRTAPKRTQDRPFRGPRTRPGTGPDSGSILGPSGDVLGPIWGAKIDPKRLRRFRVDRLDIDLVIDWFQDGSKTIQRGLLGSSWGGLGPLLGALGPSWGDLGGHLGAGIKRVGAGIKRVGAS